MAKAPPHATQREIGAAVNNAILLTKGSQFFTEFIAKNSAERVLKRNQRLRAYVEAHIAVIKDHVVDNRLNADEAVLILLSEAIVICGLFYKGLKLPMFNDFAARLLEDGPQVGDEETDFTEIGE
jgi:hypothetical protein